MQTFTPHGQSVINDLAQRYNLSTDAIIHMLYAVMNGGGTMAQFNSPELGGSGQWMQGGMTMVGDMFNGGLKNTVDNLCTELANVSSAQSPPLFVPQKTTSSNSSNNSGNWWPAELGQAASVGSQNGTGYAYFPSTQRLAINDNGHITIYDTLDHQIGGVSQQQGNIATMSFSSQYGSVLISSLPIISINGQAPQASQPMQNSVNNPEPQVNAQVNEQVETANVQANAAPANEQDIFALIEQLAGLKQKGILSEEEFANKKAELLKRL